MARKAVRSTTFMAPFISEDDGAIGEDANYDKYIETLDERHLSLVPGQKPDRFYVQRLNAANFVQLQEFMALIAEGGVKGMDAYQQFSTGLLGHCLRGFDRFEYQVSSNEYGEIVTEVASVAKGQEASEEHIALISSDPTLVYNIFKFALSLSSMSEQEKKD